MTGLRNVPCVLTIMKRDFRVLTRHRCHRVETLYKSKSKTEQQTRQQTLIQSDAEFDI